jgi:hypothetical protein
MLLKTAILLPALRLILLDIKSGTRIIAENE